MAAWKCGGSWRSVTTAGAYGIASNAEKSMNADVAGDANRRDVCEATSINRNEEKTRRRPFPSTCGTRWRGCYLWRQVAFGCYGYERRISGAK